MKIFYFPVLLVCLFSSCSSSQTHKKDYRLLGSCEGCEAVFEYGQKALTNTVTLPDYNSEGKKIMITGTIYQPDGKTPAKDVIMYVYHTDQAGRYTANRGDSGWALRNGSIRGWIKTGNDGRYTIHTLWPGIYPSRNAPAHIHPIILEPDGRYYWLNSFLFEGDSLISQRDLDPHELRGGGNGVMKMEKRANVWVGQRDIVLGKNVPGY